MGVDAVVFFDSQLAFDDLGAMPARLLAECPSVAECKDDWTIPFSWSLGWESDKFMPEVAAEFWFWASPQGVSLFCPTGHLEFRAGSVFWKSLVRWSWLKDAPARDHFVRQATELARVFRATYGLVTNDAGGEDTVLNALEVGRSLADAVASLARSGDEPIPLLRVPFTASAYHMIEFR